MGEQKPSSTPYASSPISAAYRNPNDSPSMSINSPSSPSSYQRKDSRYTRNNRDHPRDLDSREHQQRDQRDQREHRDNRDHRENRNDQSPRDKSIRFHNIRQGQVQSQGFRRKEHHEIREKDKSANGLEIDKNEDYQRETSQSERSIESLSNPVIDNDKTKPLFLVDPKQSELTQEHQQIQHPQQEIQFQPNQEEHNLEYPFVSRNDGVVYQVPMFQDFIVNLNISGRKYEFLYSFLFNNFPESQFKERVLSLQLGPYIFIDKNPNLFDVIFDFVRHQKVFLNPTINTDALIEESSFYGLEKQISSYLNQKTKFKKSFSITLKENKFFTNLLPDQSLSLTSYKVEGVGRLVVDVYDQERNAIAVGVIVFDSLIQSFNQMNLGNKTTQANHIFSGNHSYEFYIQKMESTNTNTNPNTIQSNTSFLIGFELVTEYSNSEKVLE